MNRLLLTVTIAGQRVALPSDQVHSVVELEALTPVPRAPSHVAGLSPLRSRVLTVIDCRSSLGLSPTLGPKERANAIAVEHDGHVYALLVEAIDDVAHAIGEASPVRASLGQGWNRVARGMIETDRGPMLLVNVEEIIAGSDEARAD